MKTAEPARPIGKGNVRLEFEGLGPLVKGSVEIKPLTVFIGPNGSGKSYTAMLLYALYKGITMERFILSFRNMDKTSLRARRDYYNYIYSILKDDLKDDVYKSLITVFGSIDSIVNVGSDRLNIKVATPNIEYTVSIVDNKIEIELPTEDNFISLLEVEMVDLISSDRIHKIMKLVAVEDFVRNRILMPFIVNYMPAARSGLMQAHRAIASRIIESAAILPVSREEIPRLTGVTADFLAKLISIPDRYYSAYKIPKEFGKIIDFLENKILEGTVDVDVKDKKGIIAEFMYKSKKHKLSLPVVKAASGIAELAPLALYLKYIVRPESVLIIEEPEAHLHPGLQRQVARLLAMLARNGVRVLVTTHSDILLEEFNILIRLSKLSKDERKKLGYMEDEYLPMDHLSAYLFKYDEQEHGYITEKLKVTEEEGIPQDDLTHVALEMGETHSRISHITEERDGE